MSDAPQDGPVEAVVEDERWEAAGLPALAGRAACAALRAEGLDPGAYELAVLGCDDARIATLNGAFRGRGRPTNVLAWPSEERVPGSAPAPGHLGDVALAYETCAAEAHAQGKSLNDHATHLIVHAVLHLLGHDHEDDAAASLMEGREVAILASMDLPDPYVPRDGSGCEDPVRRQKAPHSRPAPSEARS